MKPGREEAEREARIFLAVRGTIWDPCIHDVVDPAEAQVVLANSRSFTAAYQQRSPEIPGVPEATLRKLLDAGVSASPLAEIGREIQRFQQFARAGLNQLALCLYGDPEASIRLIGERIVPALT